MTEKTKTTKTEEKIQETKVMNLSDFREPDVSDKVLNAQGVKGVIGRIIMIFFVIITITSVALFFNNSAIREKMLSELKKITKKAEKTQPTEAIFSWTLESHQYGDKRTSGPEEAKITRDDPKVFNFLVYYAHRGSRQVSAFEGEKVSHGRIEGYWWQKHPQDGGRWYLEPDSENPRLYRGSHSDKSLEWTPIELVIKLN